MPSNFDEKAPARRDSRQSLGPEATKSAPKIPLIDHITNEWQTNPKYEDEHDFRPPGRAEAYPVSRMDDVLDRLDDFYDGLIDLLKSPRFRRNVFYFITAVACSTWLWFSVFKPHMQETQAALVTFDDVKPNEGLYGHNRRPTFPDVIQLRTLDPDLLPKDGGLRLPRPRSRRLIFVGDIHGCKDELVALLDKVKFNPKHDHIITTGDMINKGPNSLGVIDLLREVNASCVRGNHEDRVLLISRTLEHMLSGSDEAPKPLDEFDEERSLARKLSQEQAAYLHSCPVILRVGNISSLGGEVVVVHAGLVPGVSLENQDPASAMTMRVIDLRTHVPSRDHDRKNSVAWARLWNKVQKLIPTQHARFGQSAQSHKKEVPHMTVVYGHDSKRGLQIQRWTKGLDTGCVNGGELTALVLSAGGKQDIVQVTCKG